MAVTTDWAGNCTCNTTLGPSNCPVHGTMGVWRWWNPNLPAPTRTFVAGDFVPSEPKAKLNLFILPPVEAQRPEEV